MDKKNNLIIIAVIIIIAIVAIIFLKNNEKMEPEKPSQLDTEINQAVESDNTASINANLDNIDLSDTSDQDLQTVDQELQKL